MHRNIFCFVRRWYAAPFDGRKSSTTSASCFHADWAAVRVGAPADPAAERVKKLPALRLVLEDELSAEDMIDVGLPAEDDELNEGDEDGSEPIAVPPYDSED
jgi:hypothetical protein